MQVIPVLDIRDELVVHAFQGRRREYAPLESFIADATDPMGVVGSLLSWHPFETIYIADLNAIEQRGSSAEIILDLAQAFPGVRFWLDGGFREPLDLEPFLDCPRISLVLGSETQTSATGYEALCAALGTFKDPVLSLDYAQGQRLGPAVLFEDTRYWPAIIIAMSLDRVGADEGPDWPLLTDIKTRANDRNVVAAGGVRDLKDLEKLVSMGIHSTLIATAIHKGRLTPADIGALQAD